MSHVQVMQDGSFFISIDVFNQSNTHILDELKDMGAIDYFIDNYGCRIILQEILFTSEGANLMKQAIVKFDALKKEDLTIRESNNVYYLN